MAALSSFACVLKSGAAALTAGAAKRQVAVIPRAPPASSPIRPYTNTSVYTRADSMTDEEQLQALMREHEYLLELLKTDDSQAPWCKAPVGVVSREVQEGFAEPKAWQPHEVFN